MAFDVALRVLPLPGYVVLGVLPPPGSVVLLRLPPPVNVALEVLPPPGSVVLLLFSPPVNVVLEVLEGTVSVLGWLLGDMVRRMAMGGDAAAEFDAERRYEAGRTDGLMGVFYSDRSARPAGAVLNVPEYIKQLQARVRCSREALFLAFLYLDRVCGTWARWHAGDRQTKQWHVGPDNVQRLLLASVYAASVYLDDDHERVSFGSWVYAGKLPKEEIPTLARNFLVLLDWRLYVAPEEYLGALQQFQPIPHYLRIRHDLPAPRNRMQAGPGHWEAHPNPG
eukprot:g2557.t1